ncbi:hypothetical protein [Corynebacterium sp. A21]|uniref:hypothetical protein n=1 Tax=Corynebacterium sp. A21 TaxID=3457318 RepID=UPI003FD4988C
MSPSFRDFHSSARRLRLRLHRDESQDCAVLGRNLIGATANCYEIHEVCAPPGLIDGDIVEAHPDPEGRFQITRLVSLVPGVIAYFSFSPEVAAAEQFRMIEELEEFGLFEVSISEITSGSYLAHWSEIHSPENARQLLDTLLGAAVTVTQAQTQQQRAATLRKKINTQLLSPPISEQALRSTIVELRHRCHLELPSIAPVAAESTPVLDDLRRSAA